MTTPVARTRARLLIVPGLDDSGPDHWQSWLQRRCPQATRVRQDDWSVPDADRWARRVAETLAAQPDGCWLAVAHSFGCLALLRAHALGLALPIKAALLVAPPDPGRFELDEHLPAGTLPCPVAVVGSDDDPWCEAAVSRGWAERWGAPWYSLGAAGHINAAAGFDRLPMAWRWIQAQEQRLARAGQGNCPCNAR